MMQNEFGFVIPMDLDKHGRGPCKPNDKAKTVWEVWDHCFATLAEFDTEEEANAWLGNYIPQQRPSSPMAK